MPSLKPAVSLDAQEFSRLMTEAMRDKVRQQRIVIVEQSLIASLPPALIQQNRFFVSIDREVEIPSWRVRVLVPTRSMVFEWTVGEYELALEGQYTWSVPEAIVGQMLLQL